MAIYFNQSSLENLKLLDENSIHYGGDIFIQDNEILIKLLFENSSEMIEYLLNIPEHENVIKPLEQIILDKKGIKPIRVNNSFITPDRSYYSGYRMQFLKNAKTLLSAYKDQISYEEKVIYANQLFSALNHLHQYIVIGDIHSRNILLSDNKAYITDLDNSRKIDKRWAAIDCYYNLNFLGQYGNTKQTDLIKMYIEILGFILEVDLSKFICKYGYNEFYEIFTSYSLPDDVLKFFKQAHRLKNKINLDEELYNFEQFMSPEILERKKVFKNLF